MSLLNLLLKAVVVRAEWSLQLLTGTLACDIVALVLCIDVAIVLGIYKLHLNPIEALQAYCGRMYSQNHEEEMRGEPQSSFGSMTLICMPAT